MYVIESGSCVASAYGKTDDSCDVVSSVDDVYMDEDDNEDDEEW